MFWEGLWRFVSSWDLFCCLLGWFFIFLAMLEPPLPAPDGMLGSQDWTSKMTKKEFKKSRFFNHFLFDQNVFKYVFYTLLYTFIHFFSGFTLHFYLKSKALPYLNRYPKLANHTKITLEWQKKSEKSIFSTTFLFDQTMVKHVVGTRFYTFRYFMGGFSSIFYPKIKNRPR